MKKYLLIVLLGIAGVLLIGCNKDKSDLSEKNEENLYAVSVVAGINNIKLNAPVINLSNNNNDDNEDVEEEIDNEDQFDIMLGLVNDDAHKVTQEKSDKEDFEHLLVIEINKKDTYKFYFNELLIKEEVEKDDEDNELEEEKEFKINGIIIFNDIEYTVIGAKKIEIEKEDNESEEELELSLKIALNEDNYTVIKYETELETEESEVELEKELKFITYKDGEEVLVMSIDFELENDSKELELKIIEGNKVSIYKFETLNEKNAKIDFLIKEDDIIDEGTLDIEIITNEDGSITYQYLTN